jgi:SET and MYND domain-containing protein
MPRHGKKKKGGAPKAAPESDDVLAGRRRHVMDDMAAFEQQQFDSATQDDDSDALACKIAENEQYGRHLVATATIEAGDVIFKEKAFVAASWHEFHCIECMAPHKPAKCERVRERYSKAFRDNITTIEEIMSDMPGIDEIDRARALIRVLRMCDVDEADVAASEPLQLFLSLDQGRQPPSYEKCLTSIRALRTRHVIATSGVFPPGLTDEDIARVLAILNQCSHELEDVGGGGLFLYASLIPHSCVPNCNYVTEKDRIYLIAMRPIEAGEPLTLDFSPAFYKPTVERQAALLRSHGISCHCPGCTVLPDRCRSFRCPRAVRHCHGLPEPAGSSLSATVAPTAPCVSGTVSPVGRGEAPGDWACLKCGYHLTDVEINICLDAEQRHPAPPDQGPSVLFF